MSNDDTARRLRFEALFTAHSDALLGYALRRVTVPADAADVMADTFLVAWRRLDDLPPGHEGRLWLYGVARRVLANHRRGSGRRHRLAEELRNHLSDQLDRGPADRIETAVTVRQAMAELSDDDRELLQLTVWEGLTPTELAEVLAIPATTVRTRLHRARRRLRTEMAARGWDSERHQPSGHVEGDGRPPVGDDKEKS